MLKKVAIVGSHGLYAKYGGLEVLVKHLAEQKSDDIRYLIYNSQENPPVENLPEGVKIKYMGLKAHGFQGIFYDFFSILHCFFWVDTILLLGIQGIPFVTFLRLFRRVKVITNIGGFEWLRPKFNVFLKYYFKWCFNQSMLHSDEVILDNPYYKSFLPRRIKAKILVMSYGGEIDWSLEPTNGLMERYPFIGTPYFLSVSRALKDNQMDELCQSFSKTDHKLVLISNFSSSHYGQQVYRKFHNQTNLVLIDGLYDKPVLDLIRRNCKGYIHTHTLCGTAPSLVEMIYARRPILAVDRPQNRFTLEESGFFYSSFEQLQELLSRQQNLDAYIPPAGLLDHYNWETIVREYEKTYSRSLQKRTKRALDLFISTLGLILLCPFLIPVVMTLLLTGEHYVFYLQPRIGRGGKKFNIIKFATMLKNSPNIGTRDITIKNDPRIFPFGHFLRRTKVNEIPQLINIIRGEMSLIGPRPMTPHIYTFYSPEEQEVISYLKPGLSGVASIVFREESTIVANSPLSIEETHQKLLSPYKASLEKWYLDNQSLRLDLKILVLTLQTLLVKNSDLVYRRLQNLPEMPAELKELSR